MPDNDKPKVSPTKAVWGADSAGVGKVREVAREIGREGRPLVSPAARAYNAIASVGERGRGEMASQPLYRLLDNLNVGGGWLTPSAIGAGIQVGAGMPGLIDPLKERRRAAVEAAVRSIAAHVKRPSQERDSSDLTVPQRVAVGRMAGDDLAVGAQEYARENNPVSYLANPFATRHGPLNELFKRLSRRTQAVRADPDIGFLGKVPAYTPLVDSLYGAIRGNHARQDKAREYAAGMGLTDVKSPG